MGSARQPWSPCCLADRTVPSGSVRWTRRFSKSTTVSVTALRSSRGELKNPVFSAAKAGSSPDRNTLEHRILANPAVACASGSPGGHHPVTWNLKRLSPRDQCGAGVVGLGVERCALVALFGLAHPSTRIAAQAGVMARWVIVDAPLAFKNRLGRCGTAYTARRCLAKRWCFASNHGFGSGMMVHCGPARFTFSRDSCTFGAAPQRGFDGGRSSVGQSADCGSGGRRFRSRSSTLVAGNSPKPPRAHPLFAGLLAGLLTRLGDSGTVEV